MNENVKKLVQLIKENPDLPVILLVNEEVVGEIYDCHCYWCGSLGTSKVEEYAVFDDEFYKDRGDFEDDYFRHNEDELCEKFSYDPKINVYTVKKGQHTQEQLDENDKREAELNKYLDEIADKYFVKAIFVYIDTME